MPELPLRPAGHTSVMAHREATAPDDLDYFPTPPWAARAGGELIKQLDPAARTCWEPAAGGGHMAWGLEHYFDDVWLSDIHPYGDHLGEVRDFLADGWDLGADWIVSNPPFNLGHAFVRQALRRAKRGVAMLLRLVWLEPLEPRSKRYSLFTSAPPIIVAPFADRVPMVKGRWDPEASTATAYAWFVWRVPGGCPRPNWDMGRPTIQFIPPGTRHRLSRPEDIVRFVRPAPAVPLEID